MQVTVKFNLPHMSLAEQLPFITYLKLKYENTYFVNRIG